MGRTAKRTKQRQKTSRKHPPLTRNGKVRQGRKRVRSAEEPVPGGRALATSWEWFERPNRRGMVWDGVGWDGMSCNHPRRARLAILTAFGDWPVSDDRCGTVHGVQYRIWSYVQCNHAPHVDLDGGGGCMPSVSRCLLVKRQRRRRRGWMDLRDMVYFGGTSRRLSFGLSDGGVLETTSLLLSPVAIVPQRRFC
jgi:hypothetical protein